MTELSEGGDNKARGLHSSFLKWDFVITTVILQHVFERTPPIIGIPSGVHNYFASISNNRLVDNKNNHRRIYYSLVENKMPYDANNGKMGVEL